ncbi:MAG TPA: serine hydrolase [Devosia sp.]|jgi:beta-lactamase class A|nr:serine hydrolase [Devosia sp.]
MRKLFAIVGLLAGMTAPAALAREAEIAALKAVLAEGPVDQALFAPAFLEAVPPAELEPVLEGTKQTIGPVVAVTHSAGPTYIVETATHELSADITLDGNGRIVGLFFRPPVASGGTVEEALAEIEAVAPETAYIVTRNGEPLHEAGADTPLAAGSAFKLGVLKALREAVDAGERRWTDVAELTAADRSLPSGILQGWPEGAPLTLHTLATLMISISDNTATDALIRIVGREAVEAALGIAPALTTRELFVLKAEGDLLERYLAADVAAKRAVLEEVAGRPLPDGSKALTPHDEGAEWYLSPRALCTLMESVADLDLFAVNPGVANPAGWASVAFKGGSEVGVLNLTTAVRAEDGTRYCVAASWNDAAAIDEAKATAAYAGLLARLARS